MVNNMINRLVQKQVENQIIEESENYTKPPIPKRNAIIIYGARQVGKTTLVKNILNKYPDKARYINCELIPNRESLETTDPAKLKMFLGDSEIIILDEAQKIHDIGLTLKIIVDTYPEYQIIATGSSSFDLGHKLKEPMTGRTRVFKLYPFSVQEINKKHQMYYTSVLENLLRFGAYPEVFTLLYEKSEAEARNKLDEVASSYLYRDIFEIENLKRTDIILKLLKALALQVGNEVSINELSSLVGVSVHTIDHYLYLLQESFIIHILHSFSRNLRKELNKKIKIYFYDLGIRNSLIQNYNTLGIRTDTGALWENFSIIERIKYNSINKRRVNSYFWRTYDGQEVDYIEEHSGQLDGYEFKWNENAKFKIPKTFVDNYENARFKKIDPKNYLEFLS